MIGDLGNVYRRLAEAEANVSAMISDPSAEQIYWIEVQPNGNRVSLNAAPLRVGPLIEQYLWHEKTSVILTSATLTTHGEFPWTAQYARQLAGATGRALGAGGLALPADVLLLWRQRLGAAAVIAMLDARAPFRRVLVDLIGTGRRTLR